MPRPQDQLDPLIARAIEKRAVLLADAQLEDYRLIGGTADGIDGLFVDRYGPGLVLIEYEGRVPSGFDAVAAAEILLRRLGPAGVRAVYHKPFARDRSQLGGVHPDALRQPEPLAGEPLPESFLIRERGVSYEVRLYDGFSTGLFIDQRDNRDWLARAAAGWRVLNTFAYTCAFSVALAAAGATATSVDVSPRYLDWGRRNFEHNGLDPAPHRFARMDTFEFFAYARRKSLQYDLIILDPPTFSAGNKRRGIRTWSAQDDYAELVREAATLLDPDGPRRIFASTNATGLCLPGRLEREIVAGLGAQPSWLQLPPPPRDFAPERNRLACCMFTAP